MSHLITIELNCGLIEANKKQKQLQELSDIDTATLDKLIQLKKSVKALSYLQGNWNILSKFLGI